MNSPSESRTPPPPVMREAGYRSWACAHRVAELTLKRGNSRYTCWTHAECLQQARAFMTRKITCQRSFGWPATPAHRPSAAGGALPAL